MADHSLGSKLLLAGGITPDVKLVTDNHVHSRQHKHDGIGAS